MLGFFFYYYYYLFKCMYCHYHVMDYDITWNDISLLQSIGEKLQKLVGKKWNVLFLYFFMHFLFVFFMIFLGSILPF